tara:strand:- start:1125 stop:2408 length:1284 start_codon:yes stop_codon:yes gene_type:complete
MIEIINIILFPLALIIFFQNHLFNKLSKKRFGKENSHFDYYILNLFIILNLILLVSLFNFDIQFTTIIISIYFILVNIFNFSFKIISKSIHSLLILIIIFYVLSTYIVANPDLGWDGKFHWYKKALNFYQNMGFENLSNLPKYEYPHFGVYLWALFWSINPINFEYFGRLFYLFLYLLSIFSIVDLLNNKNLKIILFITLSLITFNFNHFTGNQDILVFSLVIFLSRYLYLIYEKKEQTLFNFILFILINNIILWIKYECIVYVILSYSILLIYKLLKKDYKYFLLISLSFLFTIIFKLSISQIYQINLNASFQFSGEYDLFKLFDINLFLYKFYIILKYYFFSLFKNPLILIGYISLALILLQKIKMSLTNIFLFILFNLSSFLIFYIIQIDFEWHVAYGIDRHILQYSGFSILFLVVFFNKIFKN